MTRESFVINSWRCNGTVQFPGAAPESGPSGEVGRDGNGASWRCPARPSKALARHEPPCFAMCVQNFTPNFEINFGSHCIILLNLHINQGILIRVHP